MKKWFWLMSGLIILTLLFIYLFIPKNIAISAVSTAQATFPGALRYMSNEEKWHLWWRTENGKSIPMSDTFRYQGEEFLMDRQVNDVTVVGILQNGNRLNSTIHLIPVSKDSVVAYWECKLPAGSDPFSRISGYRNALRLKKEMTAILRNYSTFVSNPDSLYRFPIYRGSTSDTSMLSAYFESTIYPTTEMIYGYLDVLEKSIRKQGGIKTGAPMLNVGKPENGRYSVQVAIPASGKKLSDDGPVFHRRMVPGNFMITEVKGGPHRIEEGIEELEFYVVDHRKTVMAKPFQQLITDRMQVTDTTKWLTRLYYPVVQ